MKKTVIVDIDGTISKVGERLKYLLQSPKDWDSFYNDCFKFYLIPTSNVEPPNINNRASDLLINIFFVVSIISTFS